MENVTPLHKHYILGTWVARPRCMVRWMQQSTAPWCLFNSSMKTSGCIDVALGYSPLAATSERLNEEEALLNCWNRSWIQDFGDADGIKG